MLLSNVFNFASISQDSMVSWLAPSGSLALRSAAKNILNIFLAISLQHIYSVIMDRITFSWIERKNKANQKKHSVSFEEAQTVFFDENAIEFFDPDHSETEDRFLMLGLCVRLRILVICHCYRKSNFEIRIISARKATKQEQQNYSRGIK